MNYLNIVHISDLHLKTSETTGRFNQSIIIDALIEDLQIQANGPLRPSLIVFSGDLVNAADDPDIFEEGALILEEIAKACGLTSDHVFLCPGNHDASRMSIGPSIPRLSDYRKKAKSVDGANDLYRNQDFVADVGKTFGNFNKLYANFGKKFQVQADFLTQAYDIPEFDISIICLNSATLTGAGITPDLKDEQNLFVSEISLSKIIKKIPKRKASIYIGHHPFSFLNENNDALFRTLVFKHADIYLSGHLHAARPEFVHAPQGKTSLIQAGSLYAQRDWWNGYSIISVVPDKPHHRVTYRKFHEARRAFGLATEFSDTGEVFSSDNAERFWLSIRPKVNLDKIEAWRITKLVPHIGDECGKDKSGVFDGTRFVEPEFEKDRYVNTENGMERVSQPETISFSEIFQQHENFVIFARSESGKTTLIREWARRLSCLASSSIGWKVPVILKASEIKSYKSGIDRLIRQKLPEMIDGLTHMDLLESGLLTVFIDDANIEASSVKDSIDSFVKMYPANRYIFLTSSIYLQGAGIAPVVVKGIPFSHVRLKQLKTSQLLVLIENHGTKDPAVADRLLQRMVQEATNLNVPITPVTGTFLIQIYTEDNSTDLINRANLVERYVEISLEKFAPAELLPSSFDFHNKSDLLGFVASEMARRGVYDIREEECLKWISEYLHEYGLRFSTVDLLNYFVQARILERSDGMVSFRLNAFIEFFAAKRMVDDDSFREFILDEDNYLKFTNEISFYAAISRKNKAVLVEIFERYKRDAAEAWDALPDVAKKGTALEDIFLPSPDASMAEVRQIEDKVFNKTLSEQERREALDEDSPVIPTDGKKLDRQKSDIDPGQRWVRQLTLLSSMLKNMELVSSSVKTTILTEVVQGWLQFLSMSMGLVPELSEKRRLKFAGVEYIVLFPADMEPADIARRLMLAMPISTAKIANHHLGTEKLRVQLESGIGSETGFSPSQQFMRGAILAQLGLDDLSKVLHKVSEAIEGKLYLNEVFYRLLAELVIRYRLPEAESQNIKNLAAETMVRLQGKSGKNAHALRNQVFKSLETSRLRVQIGERDGPKSLGKR